MNILITAGGTREPIDTVRSIANHATGRLGAKTADAFVRHSAGHVVYLCGMDAARPESEQVEIYPILGTEELENALRKLTSERSFDAIIHSMAVSDYRVKTVTTVSELAEAAEQRGEKSILSSLCAVSGFDQSGKLPSTIPDPVLFLEQTPKIIGMLRGLAPEAVIVGFKLLDHVPHEELLATALELLRKNHCDFVLANDAATVNTDCHEGFLLDGAGTVLPCKGKDAIAEAIAEAVLGRMDRK